MKRKKYRQEGSQTHRSNLCRFAILPQRYGEASAWSRAFRSERVIFCEVGPAAEPALNLIWKSNHDWSFFRVDSANRKLQCPFPALYCLDRGSKVLSYILPWSERGTVGLDVRGYLVNVDILRQLNDDGANLFYLSAIVDNREEGVDPVPAIGFGWQGPHELAIQYG